MSYEESFILAMRKERERRGWSQERLAREIEAATGYSLGAPAITKIEWILDPDRTYSRSIRLGEAVAIAKTLGIDVTLPVHVVVIPNDLNARRIEQIREILCDDVPDITREGDR